MTIVLWMSEPDAQELSRNELLALVTELRRELAALRAENTTLKAALARARKDSSTSSKPPSSDIVKPPRPPAPPGGRQSGGQPGHPRYERRALPPDMLLEHTLPACPVCGGTLRHAAQPPQVRQQLELVERPVLVTEHRAPAYWCPHCRQVRAARLPDEVRQGGLLGPRLTSLLALLKSAGHASYSFLARFMAEPLHAPVCRGLLAKSIRHTSGALAPIHAALAARLPREPLLNVDETGYPAGRAKAWAWCFRAPDFTVFRVANSRGARVLRETLGAAYAGVLGCDYFSAYRKFDREFAGQLGFCHAHLIRDVKFLTTLPDPATRRYGAKVLAGERRLFRAWHRRAELPAVVARRRLELARENLRRRATGYVPQRREAQNLAARFRRYGAEYFRFLEVPGLAPTNNGAERDLRPLVLDRRATQGARGAQGSRWTERIWTVLASCARQGRSAYQFILDAVQAARANRPYPSLLPAGP